MYCMLLILFLKKCIIVILQEATKVPYWRTGWKQNYKNRLCMNYFATQREKTHSIFNEKMLKSFSIFIIFDM